MVVTTRRASPALVLAFSSSLDDPAFTQRHWELLMARFAGLRRPANTRRASMWRCRLCLQCYQTQLTLNIEFYYNKYHSSWQSPAQACHRGLSNGLREHPNIAFLFVEIVNCGLGISRTSGSFPVPAVAALTHACLVLQECGFKTTTNI